MSWMDGGENWDVSGVGGRSLKSGWDPRCVGGGRVIND